MALIATFIFYFLGSWQHFCALSMVACILGICVLFFLCSVSQFFLGPVRLITQNISSAIKSSTTRTTCLQWVIFEWPRNDNGWIQSKLEENHFISLANAGKQAELWADLPKVQRKVNRLRATLYFTILKAQSNTALSILRILLASSFPTTGRWTKSPTLGETIF